MKKRIIFMITIPLFILGVFFLASYNYKSLKTDSGFDAGYDSGGYDSGGSDYSGGSSYSSSDYGDSWGSSSGGRYGGSTGDPVESLTATLFALLVFGFITIIATSLIIDRSGYMINDVTKILGEFNLNKAIVSDKVFKLVKSVQLARYNNEIDSVESLLTDKLFERLKNLSNDVPKGTYKIDDFEKRDAFVFSAAKEDEVLKIGVEIKYHVTGERTFEKATTGKTLEKEHEYVDDVIRYSVEVIYDVKNFIYDVENFVIERMDLISKVKASEDIDFGVIPATDVNKQLEKYGLDKNQVIDQAYKIYEDVQIAWMDDTLDDVKNVISNELYNQYDNQLQTLRVKNEQNVMKDFVFVDAYILALDDTKDALYIKIIMAVNCKDYIINKESGKVLRGNSNVTRNYRYQLTYRLPNVKVDKCPECGAPIEESGDKVKCQYCGSDIVRFGDDLVLTDKKIVSQ